MGLGTSNQKCDEDSFKYANAIESIKGFPARGTKLYDAKCFKKIINDYQKEFITPTQVLTMLEYGCIESFDDDKIYEYINLKNLIIMILLIFIYHNTKYNII
jgi:hypothetical protein